MILYFWGGKGFKIRLLVLNGEAKKMKIYINALRMFSSLHS